MPSSRTLANLTEAWPEEPANFELQSFAAMLVDARPALSGPALDRIEAQLSQELDRQTRPVKADPGRWRLIVGGILPVGRMITPCAAACLLIVAGVWMTRSTSQRPAAPSHPGGTLITNEPGQWQPPEPEDAAHLPRPAPTGG